MTIKTVGYGGTGSLSLNSKESIVFSTGTDLSFNGPLIESSTAGIASGKYLRIILNCSYYKILLLADIMM